MSQAYIDINPRAAAEDAWISSALQVSTIVILYYDYILTLPREIKFLWPPDNKQGWVTTACLLSRYIPVLGYLPTLVSHFITLNSAMYVAAFCGGLHVYRELYLIFVTGLVAALCIIRVYALYNCSRRVLGFLVFAILMAFAIAMGAFFASRHKGVESIHGLTSSIIGCFEFTPSVAGRFTALSWSGLLAFDSAIFSLTLYKAFTMGRGIRLLDVIVRDDKIPTNLNSTLFIMNLANILILLRSSVRPRLFLVSGPHIHAFCSLQTQPFLRSSIPILTNVLSTTLMSRLILNLREESTVALISTMSETEHRFEAALPAAPQSMTSISTYPSNDLTYKMGGIGSAQA
ncbi:hypothetical protein BC827DRAFT_1159375 [Russula dissimulans]|nr:hypothetical protein BC827DRAFT_1159375 [Russula dissimulans]